MRQPEFEEFLGRDALCIRKRCTRFSSTLIRPCVVLAMMGASEIMKAIMIQSGTSAIACVTSSSISCGGMVLWGSWRLHWQPLVESRH